MAESSISVKLASSSQPRHRLVHPTIQSSGRISVEELSKYCKSGDVLSTEGFVPDDCKISKEPVTKKWISPSLKQDPNLVHKISEFTGKSEKALKSVFERAILQDPTDYPYCTIGRIFVGWNNSSDWLESGTGCLVGPDIVLTASHVAPWDKQGTWMRFVPAYNNGNEPLGSSYVSSWRGVDYAGESGPRGYDYVVCLLEERLGDSLGYMGAIAYGKTVQYQNDFYTSVGYPGDMSDAQVPIVETFIYINDVDSDSTVDGVDSKKLEIDRFFVSPGWSGGPVWDDYPWGSGSPHVVGVVSGHEKEKILFITVEDDDVAAGGSALVAMIKWARDNWDVGSISQS